MAQKPDTGKPNDEPTAFQRFQQLVKRLSEDSVVIHNEDADALAARPGPAGPFGRVSCSVD